MKKFFISIAIGVTLFSSAAYAVTQTYQGRPYEIYQPATLPKDQKIPLLIVLHGGLGNASYMQGHLGMNPVADRGNFMVAYLNGNPGQRKIMKDKLTWNAGGGCCGPAGKTNTEDVAYIQGFIEDMIANHSADPEKIYLAGHSNGAMMAYRFVCEKPGMIAAMIAISGPLMIDHCDAPKLPVLHIHGERDDHVPVKGGIGTRSLMRDMNYRSVAETARIMTEAGASFNLKMVRGAGHSTDDIDKMLQKYDSMTLAQTISQFMETKAP